MSQFELEISLEPLMKNLSIVIISLAAANNPGWGYLHVMVIGRVVHLRLSATYPVNAFFSKIDLSLTIWIGQKLIGMHSHVWRRASEAEMRRSRSFSNGTRKFLAGYCPIRLGSGWERTR